MAQRRASPRAAQMAWASVALAVWTASVLVAPSQAIWLTIPNTGTKCVSEDIQSNVVVLADYYVIYNDVDFHDHPNETLHIPTVSARVTSPYGNNLHHQENVTQSQFAFTTIESGNYLACFWKDGKAQEGSLSVSLDWRTGINARDWESVARKEKLEGVELELRKLEGIVESIHENLKYLKQREADMREVSESTNGRVAWFSIMSIGICVSASAVQLWYLKRFFVKKKLI